jgi:hypothetical protein
MAIIVDKVTASIFQFLPSLFNKKFVSLFDQTPFILDLIHISSLPT